MNGLHVVGGSFFEKRRNVTSREVATFSLTLEIRKENVVDLFVLLVGLLKNLRIDGRVLQGDIDLRTDQSLVLLAFLARTLTLGGSILLSFLSLGFGRLLLIGVLILEEFFDVEDFFFVFLLDNDFFFIILTLAFGGTFPGGTVT